MEQVRFWKGASLLKLLGSQKPLARQRAVAPPSGQMLGTTLFLFPWKPREGAGIGEGLDYFFLGCYSLELEPCPPVLFLHLCSCSLNLRADLEWSLQEAQDVCRGILLDERPALSTWLAMDQEDYSAHCCPKPWNTWESPGQKVTLKPYDQVHEKLKCPLKIELTKELSL